VKQDAIIVSTLGHRVQLGDFVEIRLLVGVRGLFLADTRAFHVLAEVWETPDELRVIVGVPVSALSDTTEPPTVCLKLK
jgi:hypothetical protein